MMEVIHHFISNEDEKILDNADICKCFKKSAPFYLMAVLHVGGLTGNGGAFILRDAHGIRPAYYYINDEVIVAASERAAIRTSFNVGENEVHELMPGKSADY